MPNLPLSHWSSQLFDLRPPSSTDVLVLWLTDWKSFCFVLLCFFFFGGGGGVGDKLPPATPPHPRLGRECLLLVSLFLCLYDLLSRPPSRFMFKKSPTQTKCDAVHTLSITKPFATKSLEEQGSPLCNCWSKMLKNVIHLHKETGVLRSENSSRLSSPDSGNETWRKACHGLNSSLTVFLLDVSNVIKSCYPKYAEIKVIIF